MSGIFVVAFLVNCGQSLLLCEEVDTRDLAFRDMAACQAQIGTLVADQRQKQGAARVIMGKCRYLLIDPPRTLEVAGEQPRVAHAAALAAHGGTNRAERAADRGHSLPCSERERTWSC